MKIVDTWFNALLRVAKGKPKPPHEEPYFADIYARAMAAALDFSLIYLLLNTPFRLLTSRLYRHVDTQLLSKAQLAQGAEMYRLLWESQLPFWWLVNASIQLLLIGAFVVGAQWVWGVTPGKWLLGLRVVRYPSLEKPSRWRYLLRFLAYIPSAGSFMIGVFWASFNAQHRTWHDYIAGTAVLNDRPPSWYWQKAKALYKKLRGGSGAVEQPVRKPAAEERE